MARKGQFQKGQSGNPAGRPKNTWREYITLGDYEAALSTLRALLDCKSPKVRFEAAAYLVDQAIGKAPASLDLTSAGQPLTLVSAVPRPVLSKTSVSQEGELEVPRPPNE